VVPIISTLFPIVINTQKHIKERKRIRNIRKKLTTEKTTQRQPYKNLKFYGGIFLDKTGQSV
jgi:hypothetical protein